MAFIKIKIIEKCSDQVLRRWKDRMLEEPKCCNTFCFECYSKEDLCAVRVTKEGDARQLHYITTLCNDCIQHNSSYGILVNEKDMYLDVSVEN